MARPWLLGRGGLDGVGMGEFSATESGSLGYASPRDCVSRGNVLCPQLTGVPVRSLSLVTGFEIRAVGHCCAKSVQRMSCPVIRLLVSKLSSLPMEREVDYFRGTMFVRVGCPPRLCKASSTGCMHVRLTTRVFDLAVSSVASVTSRSERLCRSKRSLIDLR